MFLLCAGCKHPVEVAGDHVNLDIELSALRESSQRRLMCGVRNDVHREMRAVVGIADFVHGERHAVERDRALLRDGRSERAIDAPRSMVSTS